VVADLRTLERATVLEALERLAPVADRVAGVVAVEVDPKRIAGSAGVLEPPAAAPAARRGGDGRTAVGTRAGARARLHHR
jgi:hypothetical protein